MDKQTLERTDAIRKHDDGMACMYVSCWINRQNRELYGETCDCKGLRWTCKGCTRFVPYCNGGHSDDAILDDLCDQCAVVVMQQRRDRGEPDVQPRVAS